MIIQRVLVGFVVQKFDTDNKRFTEQEFVSSDDRSWEHANGDGIDMENPDERALVYGITGTEEPVMDVELVQPNSKLAQFDLGEHVFVSPSKDEFGPQNEFQGFIVGFKGGKYIQVRDQEDNVFDCEPEQVQNLK